MKAKGRRTVSDVVSEFGVNVEARIRPYFNNRGVDYPPEGLAMIAMKDERRMELWAYDQDRWSFIKSYDIQGSSGVLGPKLREGDLQVPEGIYKVVGLNPNSSFHLSMKLNYPNAFDLKWAEIEGRDNPGSDIFIHGRDVSIGCLAMGDQAIEELFIISERVGISYVQVIIAPTDPRKNQLAAGLDQPDWVKELYNNITEEWTKITNTEGRL